MDHARHGKRGRISRCLHSGSPMGPVISLSCLCQSQLQVTGAQNDFPSHLPWPGVAVSVLVEDAAQARRGYGGTVTVATCKRTETGPI